MKIVNLTEEYKSNYFVCLEDWSDEIREAGNHKEHWYRKMKDKGLCVKLALNDEGPVSMIQYIPIEYSFVEGSELYFILCIWVHGYKNKGVGNYQKQGIGKALIMAAEKDVKKRGVKGLVAWGVPLVFHEINTFSKKEFDEWGISDSLFINRKKVNTGPPPSYKKIKKKIAKKLKKENE